MNPILTLVAEKIDRAYVHIFDAKPPIEAYISLALTDQNFGDVQSNIAMQVAAELKLPPREIAKKLADELKEEGSFSSVEVAGAGFINIRMHDSTILRELPLRPGSWNELRARIEQLGQGKRVVMDYSHPNIGKPMGVHHLLSTIIGDSVKRTLMAGGYDVIADNFIGDLGTQFGKLIWAVKEWGDIATIEADPITELQKLYVKFHIEADKDLALDDAGREEYRKLEAGDLENRALWKKIIGWSKAEIQPIYDDLDISFDYMHGESFYEDKMQPILDSGQQQGVLVASQGALVCFLDDAESPPAVLRKSDGATLYITRDLARIDHWEKTWQPDYMLVVVDIAQNFGQKQLYEVAQKLHLTDAELTQVNFGRMRFADGGMSTRKGNILLLKDLIIEGKSRALKLVSERSHGLNESEVLDLAHTLGIGAIKYNVLSQNRLSDITFDWNTMLSFQGNSAPYLLYTCVRLKSLLKKSEIEGLADQINVENTTLLSTLGNGVERELALALTEYQPTFNTAIHEYKPSTLANYIYELAQLYNNLYNNQQILDAPAGERMVRLRLSQLTLHIMQHGLNCLGISIPDKM